MQGKTRTIVPAILLYVVLPVSLAASADAHSAGKTSGPAGRTGAGTEADRTETGAGGSCGICSSAASHCGAG